MVRILSMERAENQKLIELTRDELDAVYGGSTPVAEADLLPPPTPYPHVNPPRLCGQNPSHA
jgi:hypothetical protein